METAYEDFRTILNIGIELTTEKNPERLLHIILESGMSITNCDAGTLYMFEDDKLVLKIRKTLSLKISRGEDGAPIEDISPVPFQEENVCAYCAIHRKVVNIPDVYHSDTYDFSGIKRNDALAGCHTGSMLVIPLENNEKELVGVLRMINARDELGEVIPFDSKYEIIVHYLGSLASFELMNIQYVEELNLQLRSFVEAMATAIDERTPYNGSHTRKVAEYAGLLADKINEKQKMGECQENFDELHKEKLILAALLHDIGKMVIPRQVMNRATRLDHDIQGVEDRFALLNCYYEIDFLKRRISGEEYEKETASLSEWLGFIRRIDNCGYLEDEDYERVQLLAERKYIKEDGNIVPYLTKRERDCLSIRQGTLTDSDRVLMESHVEMTNKILNKVRFNKNYRLVPIWAGEHHEFLNGSGYPCHLTGDKIPLEARILTIADIFDALTASDRPYKKPMPTEKAVEVLQNMAAEGKVEKRLVDWLEEAVLEVRNVENV